MCRQDPAWHQAESEQKGPEAYEQVHQEATDSLRGKEADHVGWGSELGKVFLEYSSLEESRQEWTKMGQHIPSGHHGWRLGKSRGDSCALSFFIQVLPLAPFPLIGIGVSRALQLSSLPAPE